MELLTDEIAQRLPPLYRQEERGDNAIAIAGFVVVENVPGLLRKKRKSILPRFLRFLADAGYAYDDGIVNANHFGVPQDRMRYLLVASDWFARSTCRSHRRSQVPLQFNEFAPDGGNKSSPQAGPVVAGREGLLGSRRLVEAGKRYRGQSLSF